MIDLFEEVSWYGSTELRTFEPILKIINVKTDVYKYILKIYLRLK